jgi:hypothetical protein
MIIRALNARNKDQRRRQRRHASRRRIAGVPPHDRGAFAAGIDCQQGYLDAVEADRHVLDYVEADRGRHLRELVEYLGGVPGGSGATGLETHKPRRSDAVCGPSGAGCAAGYGKG